MRAITTSLSPRGLTYSKFIWGLYILGMFSSFVGVGPYAGTVAVVLVQGIFLCYLLAIYAARRGKPLYIGLKPTRNCFGAASTLAGILLFWAGLSLLWTPRPFTASAYYLSNLIDVLISYMLCKLYPIKDVFFAACKGTAYAAAAAIPLSIVLVGFSGGRLGGESANSMVGPISNAGVLGTMGITYLVLNKAISKHLAIVFFIIYMSSLILTFNKTGIISFILASTVSVILAPGNFRQHVKRISITAVGLTVAVFAAFSKITAYVNKTGAGSVETLSGRTALWEDTYRQIINGPYIRGFGETAFRAIGPNLAHTAAHNVHPHNEFLAVWFNFGLVGVVLVYSSYLALTIVSWKAFRHGFGHLPILVLCAVVYYFVAGIAAASFSMCLFPIQWLLLYDCLISTHFETHKRSRIPRLI